MRAGDDLDRVRQVAARRGRAMLYTVGGGLVAGAMLLDLLPSLASFNSPLRVKVMEVFCRDGAAAVTTARDADSPNSVAAARSTPPSLDAAFTVTFTPMARRAGCATCYFNCNRVQPASTSSPRHV